MAIPTEQEQLEQGLATMPEDLEPVAAPVIPDGLTVGAYVQARRFTGDGVATAEFYVTGVSGLVVAGSPLGDLDGNQGWTFEVIRRAPLTLPTTRTTIIATLLDGSVVELMGRGTVWMNDDGDLVPADHIVSFELAG